MEANDEETHTAPPEEQETDGGKTCEHCGEPIDTSDWYLVSKQRDSDGSLQFASFCSEECQTAWQEEQEDHA